MLGRVAAHNEFTKQSRSVSAAKGIPQTHKAAKSILAAKQLREEISSTLTKFQESLVNTGNEQTKTQAIQAEALATRLSDSLHRFGGQQKESLDSVI